MAAIYSKKFNFNFFTFAHFEYTTPPAGRLNLVRNENLEPQLHFGTQFALSWLIMHPPERI